MNARSLKDPVRIPPLMSLISIDLSSNINQSSDQYCSLWILNNTISHYLYCRRLSFLIWMSDFFVINTAASKDVSLLERNNEIDTEFQFGTRNRIRITTKTKKVYPIWVDLIIQ